MTSLRPVIIGGGPAGISAASTLVDQKIPCLLLEKDKQMGGLCKTVEYRVSVVISGGTGFLPKTGKSRPCGKKTLGDEFLVRPRLSRILLSEQIF